MAPPAKPPFQLVRGDPFNMTLGCVIIAVLAAAKHVPGIPDVMRWHLRAYTNWNLIFIMVRMALQQSQWDPFLLCNSMGIMCGFRVALTQGLDENLRDKLNSINTIGPPLGRVSFKLADHICHTLPPIVLLLRQVQSGKSVPRANSAASIIIFTWFAFRQGAKLDAGDQYVPHPWRLAWLGIVLGGTLSPPLVDALIKRRHGRTLLCVATMLLPWLVARCDRSLKARYNFEYALQKAQEKECKSSALLQEHERPFRRISSTMH
eukprot:gb/GFBE01079100.1/.p1 GENE.gb/GFBE01079100.1/~~gb/GFBE01079100.1/.p1  ORF type:complete len:263 (+),score=39.71 gb/GFBE01079100.1/:1-789(+)